MRKLTKLYINELTYEIIGAAIEVHKEMGPGLLESVYEKCMIQELKLRGIRIPSTTQKIVPVTYKGVRLDADLRYDLLIDNCILVELKAVIEMAPIFNLKL